MSAIVLVKYTNEMKLKVAQYNIEQKLNIENTVKYFNIPSVQIVRNWAKKYQKQGLEGLLKK